MGARHSIKNPKDREVPPVKTEGPNKLRPERSNTDVNYNATGEISNKTDVNKTVQRPAGENSSSNKSRVAKKAALPYTRSQLPYYLNEILKEADSPQEINKSSIDQLYGQLYNGVHLKQNKMKYWVDRTNNANCFMLYAHDLSITWGGDTRYWIWVDIEETSAEKVLAAELKSVCWLEVCGKFDTAALNPETLYEVVFVVKIKKDADGLESITMRLIIPNKSNKDVTVNLLNEQDREKWKEVAGEFSTSSEFKRKKKREEIEIFLYETERLNCKQGLVIKGIAIRPKA